MTQQTHFFVGQVNCGGERILCVGARVSGPKPAAVPELIALDSLTARYGSQIPEPNEEGYVVRRLAPDVSFERAEKVLERVGHVTVTPEMSRESVVELVGAGALKGL